MLYTNKNRDDTIPDTSDIGHDREGSSWDK